MPTGGCVRRLLSNARRASTWRAKKSRFPSPGPTHGRRKRRAIRSQSLVLLLRMRIGRERRHAPRRYFAKATVSDFTDLADGAPDGWGKAVSVALDQLGLLKTGEAAFRDKELTFIGEATDEQAASAVRRTLKLDVPQNFKIIDRIRYPRPDLPAAGIRLRHGHRQRWVGTRSDRHDSE